MSWVLDNRFWLHFFGSVGGDSGEVFGVKIFFVGPWIAQENFQMVSIGILQRSWVKKVQVSTHQVSPTFLMLGVMTSAGFI